MNKNHPERNKVISKTADGTKINQKPYLNNWKSVRESLGILLSNNFLIADKTLVVEGSSDVIYILDSIKRLKEAGSVDIDLNDLSIVDAGDFQNYVAMTKLMLSEGREIVALVDGNTEGDRIKNDLKRVCEEELKSKKLTVFQLDKDKSIEDFCTDAKFLKKAVKGVVNDLVSQGVRKLKSSINLDAELRKIKRLKTRTLGKTINNITSNLFDPEDKVSKLSIALKYEDLVKEENIEVGVETLNLVKKIKKMLNIKGEKAAERGVFEEAK